jgi:hypothetical protein
MLHASAARFLAGGLFLIYLLLAGCATPLQSDRLARSAFPEPIELTAVKFFPQEEYQCGPAALAMALNWAGKNVTPEMLAPEVYLPTRQGSLQLELLANARRRGTVPYVVRPELQALLTEVAEGHPVVVFQNLGLSWYPKWHYAVLVGFDLERDQLVLRSGTEERHQVPLAVFERTWRRGGYWAMVVMPAGRLPRTAEETPYLRAVVALERLQHWEEASEAYRTAIVRWPGSLAAQLGLGNSRYALGDKRGAEEAYRTAVITHPDSGIAFNNLAQTLADQGRWQEAEVAAQQAIALGGPHVTTYRATLAEIRAKRAAGKSD